MSGEVQQMTREQIILVTGMALGAIGMWVFPLVTGVGCIQ
jgi:hypothetical protein